MIWCEFKNQDASDFKIVVHCIVLIVQRSFLLWLKSWDRYYMHTCSNLPLRCLGSTAPKAKIGVQE